MNRTAAAVWTGPLKEGKGILSTRSTILSQTRYAHSNCLPECSGTNPEELLAAALASSFTLELVARLEDKDMTATSIHTWVAVTLDSAAENSAISSLHLDLIADIPKAEAAAFAALAEQALATSAVARLFAIPPTLTAKLASANSRHAPMPPRPMPGDVVLHASPTGI